MTPDHELVADAMAGRPGAFERLVREHQRLVSHLIQRLVRDPEDTRELCQEAFLRVHRQLHQFRFESALRTWIGRIACSIALRHLERGRLTLVDLHGSDDEPAVADTLPDNFDLEAACADAQLRGHLLAAVDALPALPRLVLTLYHLDELSIPEIAQVTGLAAGTIKSHLFRSRLKLRDMLQAVMGVTR